MNEVKLQGQITSDPEVKESRNGILRGSFFLTYYERRDRR